MARKNQYIKQVDQLIGEKIYSLRLAKGYARQQLADLIEVTHQQLQKYEKGINRISTGRLMLIAKALDKNIDYFLEGLGNTGSAEPVLTQHQLICIEVSRNFMKIRVNNFFCVCVKIRCINLTGESRVMEGVASSTI